METKKIVPYRTSTGILIGQFYERKFDEPLSDDMALLQCALLNDPTFLRKVKVKNMTYVAFVIGFITLAAMVAK